MRTSRSAALLVVLAMVAACGQSATGTAPRSVTLPPVTGVFDYQLGGAYDLPDLAVVVRDESAVPRPGAYNVCYLNGFQTQPGTGGDWLKQRPNALLRDGDGSTVADPDWPDEFILDPSTPAQRDDILDAVGPMITGCARKGFAAVEIDNFDTFTRFTDAATGLVERAGALELARAYVSRAHAEGLAIGQKNAAESTDTGHRDAGFDFAVAEECAAYGECASYSRAYGPHVLQIEYTDNLPEPFTGVCGSAERAPLTILRDRRLVAPGADGYAYDRCR